MSESAVKHCEDNAADRKIGEHWERQFCVLAAEHGKTFTPMQIGRQQSAQAYGYDENRKWNHRTLPDVTVWTSPGEHHEIKHKAPTKHDSIGLEKYRLDALRWFADETRQSVQYTIHRHDLSGGRGSKVNKIEHWFTASIATLWHDLETGNAIVRTGPTWINGQKKDAPIVYWKISLWVPLGEYWLIGNPVEESSDYPF